MRYKEPFTLYARRIKNGKSVWYYRTYDSDGNRTSGKSTGLKSKTATRELVTKLIKSDEIDCWCEKLHPAQIVFVYLHGNPKGTTYLIVVCIMHNHLFRCARVLQMREQRVDYRIDVLLANDEAYLLATIEDTHKEKSHRIRYRNGPDKIRLEPGMRWTSTNYYWSDTSNGWQLDTRSSHLVDSVPYHLIIGGWAGKCLLHQAIATVYRGNPIEKQGMELANLYYVHQDGRHVLDRRYNGPVWKRWKPELWERIGQCQKIEIDGCEYRQWYQIVAGWVLGLCPSEEAARLADTSPFYPLVTIRYFGRSRSPWSHPVRLPRVDQWVPSRSEPM